jgi:hypothetical protein
MPGAAGPGPHRTDRLQAHGLGVGRFGRSFRPLQELLALLTVQRLTPFESAPAMGAETLDASCRP